MTAFTVVRFRTRGGSADHFREVFASLKRDFQGLARLVLIKTGDHEFCSIGEWTSFEHIVGARPLMKQNLDQMRHLLESFSEQLGVTDPVSGESVFDTGTLTRS